MRVTILNSWHDSNKGDSAILQGSLLLMNGLLGNPHFTVVPSISKDNPLFEGALRHTLSEFPQLEVAQHPLPPFPKSKAYWMKTIPYSLLRLSRLASSLPGEEIIARSDLVVMTGGLYLAFPHQSLLRPPLRLWAYLYPALLANQMGKPLIYFGHSFGPFNNKWSTALMSSALAKAKCVIARESTSAQLAMTLLRNFRNNKTRVLTAPDPAFYLRPRSSLKAEQVLATIPSKDFAIIAPRSLVPYGHSSQAEELALNHFLEVIQILSAQGLHVVLVAHTLGPGEHEDDRKAVYKLASSAKSHGLDLTLVQEDLAPAELMFLFSRARVVLSVRFHGAILSLASGTPAVVVPYFGTKAQGTYADLGLKDLIVGIEEAEEKLNIALKKALELPRSFMATVAEEARSRLKVAMESCLEEINQS